MRILYVSAEIEPFAKSGGMGDVVGALPKAVKKLGGNKVFAVMPKYKIIADKYKSAMQYVGYYYVDVNWRHQYCGVFRMVMSGVTWYFLDNEYYFSGDSIYCFADNERFAFFCKAALDLAIYEDLRPDVIHANDWSTALVPVLYDAFYRGKFTAKTVYTVHNMRYQGKMSQGELQDLTGLPDFYFAPDRLIENGAVNLMKGGIVFSDAVTTVSPTYARDIGTPLGGEGLDGVVRCHQGKIFGILNGVDYTVYNPLRDGALLQKYGITAAPQAKPANKTALQNVLGLPVAAEKFIVGLVSRLVEQKGIDLVAELIEQTAQNVSYVVLGSGESRYEQRLRQLADKYANVSVTIGFDDALAHLIYAACDAMVVPSLFEPCGLSQIIALKYGAIPIVRRTGGLADTVTEYDAESGSGNGFTFDGYDAWQLVEAVRRAERLYGTQDWDKLRRNAMHCKFGWKNSSEKYVELYRKITGGNS